MKFRIARLAALTASILVACSPASLSTGSPPASPTASPSGQASASSSGLPTFDLSGVKLTVTQSNISPPASLARSVELFGEWGAKVNLVQILTGTQALLAGESDIAGSHGAGDLIVATSQGADLVGIGSPTSQLGDVFVARTQYKEIADLKGAKIATSGPGEYAALMATLLLRSAGLKPEDVTMATIGFTTERAAALLAGQADAAVIPFDTWISIQEKSKDLHVLATLAQALPGISGPIYFSKRGFWKDNPKVALAWACANLEANAWFAADQDRYVAFWLKRLPDQSPESLAATWKFQMQNKSWPTEPDAIMSVKGLQIYADAMVEVGKASPIDASKVLDFTYLEKAKAMGCGSQ
jgi:NitT/TauT family transport system substrate-binding protein